ncbi:hypothetical protein BKA62DRAFT_680325 [Auriculariales sp. MPI-PUGE-AT-0066]|nr:hypothetical protein BKA62DRAFT_680325 [Auriculariales sp. MPI-PUGE-AT-0066]
MACTTTHLLGIQVARDGAAGTISLSQHHGNTVPPPVAASDSRRSQRKAGKEAPAYKECSPKKSNFNRGLEVSAGVTDIDYITKTNHIDVFPSDSNIPTITVYGRENTADLQSFAAEGTPVIWDGDGNNDLVRIVKPTGNQYLWQIGSAEAADWVSFLLSSLCRGQSVIVRRPANVPLSTSSYAEVLSNFYAEHKWVEVQVPGVFAGQQLRRPPGTKDNYWMLMSTFTDWAESSDVASTCSAPPLLGQIFISSCSESTSQNYSGAGTNCLAVASLCLNFIFDSTCDALPVFTPTISANQLNFVIAAHIWLYSGLHVDASGQPTAVRMIQGKKIWMVRRAQNDDDRWHDPWDWEEQEYHLRRSLLRLETDEEHHAVISPDAPPPPPAGGGNNEPTNASHNSVVLSIFDHCGVYLMQACEEDMRATCTLISSGSPQLPPGYRIRSSLIDHLVWIQTDNKINTFIGIIFAEWISPREIDQYKDLVQHSEQQPKHALSWVRDYLHWRQLLTHAALQLQLAEDDPSYSTALDWLQADVFNTLLPESHTQELIDTTLNTFKLDPTTIKDINLIVDLDSNSSDGGKSTGDGGDHSGSTRGNSVDSSEEQIQETDDEDGEASEMDIDADTST